MLSLKRQCNVVLVLTALVSGCGDGGSDGAGGSGGGGQATTSSGGETCYDVPVNETNDGSAACGPEVCEGGTYCVSDVGICDPGCEDELNCPAGQFCDLSNAGASGIGLCRTPGPEHETPCTTGGDCSERCLGRAADCGAPDDIAQEACGSLCPGLSDSQLDCLDSTACEELAAIYEGGEVCGITGPSD